MSTRGRRDIFICGVQFDQELRSGAMSVLELAPIAARLGAQGVEYRDVYWKDKARELPAVRDQLAQLGLKATYATFTTLYNRDPVKQKQLLQDVDDAHALGSPLMRVFQGEPPRDDPEDAAVREATLAAIKLASSYGMRLALENFRGSPGGRLAEIKETLRRLASPVMGTNIDTSNYATHGEDPVQAIRELADQVIYCHLKDAKRTPEGLKPTYLGNGILPMRDIIAALDAIGRDFPLCFEFGGEGDPESAITKSMEYLAKL